MSHSALAAWLNPSLQIFDGQNVETERFLRLLVSLNFQVLLFVREARNACLGYFVRPGPPRPPSGDPARQAAVPKAPVVVSENRRPLGMPRCFRCSGRSSHAQRRQTRPSSARPHRDWFLGSGGALFGSNTSASRGEVSSPRAAIQWEISLALGCGGTSSAEEKEGS